MASESQRDNTLSALNLAIDVLNLTKEVSSIALAKAVFGSVVLLTMIRVRGLQFCDNAPPPFTLFQDSASNEQACVEQGLNYADLREAPSQGPNRDTSSEGSSGTLTI